jgi:hypothetical protein
MGVAEHYGVAGGLVVGGIRVFQSCEELGLEVCVLGHLPRHSCRGIR